MVLHKLHYSQIQTRVEAERREKNKKSEWFLNDDEKRFVEIIENARDYLLKITQMSL